MRLRDATTVVPGVPRPVTVGVVSLVIASPGVPVSASMPLMSGVTRSAGWAPPWSTSTALPLPAATLPATSVITIEEVTVPLKLDRSTV